MNYRTLSHSSLKYLDSIDRLGRQRGCVHPIDLARDLKVTKPSVTKAVKLLADNGLVCKNPRGEIGLTAQGVAAAEALRGRCRVLHEFFESTVGESCELSRQELRCLSCSLSDEAIDAIQAYLRGEAAARRSDAAV